ncbi:periplasmic heavy metal sensor [Thalassobaculum salexigens]|uniref:periplasmic heavy metal sensor n=1 Tax=Thalassobaculum salexigens TaxID=455360 RepID=UPI0004161E7E|nr:periplasmic heavy metal sensor [Thalassobaculum salexigens]
MTRTRWLILLLLASLGVNLFIGGLAIGRWVDHGWGGRGGPGHFAGPPPPDGPGPRWLRRMVGEDGIDTVRTVWQRHETTIDPLRRDADAARSAVADTLSADPFVRADYEAALGRMRAARDRMETAVHAAITDVVTSMTPEQRHAFAERARAWADRHKGPPPPSD